MSATDDSLAANVAYARGFELGGLPTTPAKRLAVITCMDSRIDVLAILGLREGDAHVIRNAGGVVTDDEIRSLAISQHLLGTREVMLIQHTRCGLLEITDEELARRLEEASGERPGWSAEAIDDLALDVPRQIGRILASPFVPHKGSVRGFIYDVDTGLLREVAAPAT
ncbi:MAG: carbonic anhydrase [Solirubrobacterales bacterium]